MDAYSSILQERGNLTSEISPHAGALPRTTLARGGLYTTRLGFGCSRLHHLTNSKARQFILSRAYDLGIRHFDVAPLYGQGLAERELGAFLKGRRTDCVVATKYGLPPSRLIDGISSRLPFLSSYLIVIQAVAKRLLPVPTNLPLITADGLESSLRASLRRLGTNYVDILLLHEPFPDRIRDLPSVIQRFEALRTQGMVRFLGLAGDASACEEIWKAAERPDLIVQLPEHEWRESFNPDITFGVLGRGSQSRFSRRPALGGVEVVDRLSQAFARRSIGTVLVSTTKPDHLSMIVATVESAAFAL